MEGWLYGLFALLGVLVGSGFSYLGIKMNLTQQDKIDSRQWRRKVRGEPLLKLREELARMATKQARYLSAAIRQHTHFDVTEEQVHKELQIAMDDWNKYLMSGEFSQTMLMQFDIELKKRAEEVLRDFQNSSFIEMQAFLAAKRGTERPPIDERLKSLKAFERNESKILEIQELINERLEEL